MRGHGDVKNSAKTIEDTHDYADSPRLVLWIAAPLSRKNQKRYQTNILLSENSHEQLSPRQQGYCRFLGRVRVKGKEQVLGIYECLDGEPKAIRDKKMATREGFEAGLQAYLRGALPEAEAAFTKVLELHGQDQVARYFLKRLRQVRAQGLPEGWTGVEEMGVK